jgi:hypothetical protein
MKLTTHVAIKTAMSTAVIVTCCRRVIGRLTRIRRTVQTNTIVATIPWIVNAPRSHQNDTLTVT